MVVRSSFLPLSAATVVLSPQETAHLIIQPVQEVTVAAPTLEAVLAEADIWAEAMAEAILAEEEPVLVFN